VSAHSWVYKTAAWLRIRALRLAEEPLCRFCAKLDRTVPATIVDHITPHRGDRDLAFDYDNTQSLCETCHNKFKQIQEKGGVLPGCDADGYPIDPAHPWY
jgi:5-methylcytosine-specific restriction endonuclease McrA